MENRPQIICLTPVRNEDWILETFLKATSLWADYIILLDQLSTDNTKIITSKFEKVIYLENHNEEYDENYRQKILLEEARKISGDKLLITLDADEFFVNPDISSPSWQTMLNAEKGTVFSFNWLYVSPDFKKSKTPVLNFPWGTWAFMDDGSAHSGRIIHSPRVPIPAKSKNISINDNYVLHYNLVSPGRLESKNRWYMMFEVLHNLNSNKITQNYKYDYESFFDQSDDLDISTFDAYRKNGVDMFSVKKDILSLENNEDKLKTWKCQETYWWDIEALKLMEKHGAKVFRHLDIWTFDWKSIAILNSFADSNSFNDPRSFKDKLFIKWVRYSKTRSSRIVKLINKFVLWIY